MRTTATAIFADHAAAGAAIAELRTKGIVDENVAILGRDQGAGTEGEPGVGMGIDGDADRFIDDSGDQQLTEQGRRNAARGAIGGGALGGLIGISMLAIPGVGPFLAAGTIASLLTGGVALGASLGTIREILTKHGLEEDEIEMASGRIDAGDVFVSVETADAPVPRDEVIDTLRRNGGEIVQRTIVAA